MKVYFPTACINARYPKGNIIQGFGENRDLYHSVNPNLYGHPGIDLTPTKGYGQQDWSPYDGTIAAVAYLDPNLTDYQLINKQGYGNEIAILSDDTINGWQVLSVLAHLTGEKIVTVGQKVKALQTVGFMGNSGFVVSGGVEYWGHANPDKKGTHTHWKTCWLKEVPPGQHSNTSYLGKNYIIKDFGNGLDNSFDPLTLNPEVIMSNAKLIKIGNEVGYWTPAITGDGLKSQAANYGDVLPQKADGSIDFDKITYDHSI